MVMLSVSHSLMGPLFLEQLLDGGGKRLTASVDGVAQWVLGDGGDVMDSSGRGRCLALWWHQRQNW
jgi:hypothetical protein